jgi:hypothetical protein
MQSRKLKLHGCMRSGTSGNARETAAAATCPQLARCAPTVFFTRTRVCAWQPQSAAALAALVGSASAAPAAEHLLQTLRSLAQRSTPAASHVRLVGEGRLILTGLHTLPEAAERSRMCGRLSQQLPRIGRP